MFNGQDPDTNVNPQPANAGPLPNTGPLLIPEMRLATKRSQIETLVRDRAKGYPAHEHKYQRALPLYDTLIEECTTYNADARRETDRARSRSASNQRQVSEGSEKLKALRESREKLEKEKTEIETRIRLRIEEREEKESDFKSLVWDYDLPDVKPTFEGFRDALRQKFGVEDSAALNARLGQAKDKLEQLITTRHTPTASPSSASHEPTEHWLVLLRKNILLYIFTAIAGIFTGISFGTAARLITYNPLQRFRWDPAVPTVIIFGIGLISVLGWLTGRVMRLIYDDKRQSKSGRMSGETKVFGILLLVLLLVEVVGDMLGLQVMFARNSMVGVNVPSFLVCPIALAFALPVMLLKAVQTTASARNLDNPGGAANMAPSYSAYSAYSAEEMEGDQQRVIQTLTERIKEASEKQKELEAFKRENDPNIGAVTEVLKVIEKFDKLILQDEEKRDTLDDHIQQSFDDEQVETSKRAAKDVDAQISPDVMSAFKKRENEIRQKEREMLNLLSAV